MVLFVLCRKVVEHVCLLKAKKFLSDEDEKDMLDYLYTSQYQMRGIVAVSLGHFLFIIQLQMCILCLKIETLAYISCNIFSYI
jgi:hypothetical protein